MQAARGASLNSSDPEAIPRTGTPGHPRLWATFLLVASTLYAVDVTTKIIAVERLSGRGTVEIFGSWFGLHLTRNPGAAFSLGSDYTPVIAVVQISVAVVVAWLARKLGSTGWALAFGFLFGGAVGNIIDRIFRDPSPFHGHVIDFLQLPHWAIFNIADMAVTTAAVLMVLQTLRGIKLDGTRETKATSG